QDAGLDLKGHWLLGGFLGIASLIFRVAALSISIVPAAFLVRYIFARRMSGGETAVQECRHLSPGDEFLRAEPRVVRRVASSGDPRVRQGRYVRLEHRLGRVGKGRGPCLERQSAIQKRRHLSPRDEFLRTEPIVLRRVTATRDSLGRNPLDLRREGMGSADVDESLLPPDRVPICALGVKKESEQAETNQQSECSPSRLSVDIRTHRSRGSPQQHGRHRRDIKLSLRQPKERASREGAASRHVESRTGLLPAACSELVLVLLELTQGHADGLHTCQHPGVQPFFELFSLECSGSRCPKHAVHPLGEAAWSGVLEDRSRCAQLFPGSRRSLRLTYTW